MKPLRSRRSIANWPAQRVYWKCMDGCHILGLAALILAHWRNCFESVTAEFELCMRLSLKRAHDSMRKWACTTDSGAILVYAKTITIFGSGIGMDSPSCITDRGQACPSISNTWWYLCGRKLINNWRFSCWTDANKSGCNKGSGLWKRLATSSWWSWSRSRK